MPESSIPRSPREFFTEVVPKVFADVVEDLVESPGWLAFEVLDSGEWSFNVSDSTLHVFDGIHEETLIRVTIDISDWEHLSGRLINTDTHDMAGFAERAARMFASPQATAVLSSTTGTAKFVMTSDSGDHWMAITFGGVEPSIDEPRVGLTMPDDVGELLLSGKANPQELFMSGKMRVTGDMMLLLQLAPLMS